jgi:hypothetical protein
MHDRLLPFMLAASLAWLAVKRSQSRSRYGGLLLLVKAEPWVRAEDADRQNSGKVSLPSTAEGIRPMEAHSRRCSRSVNGFPSNVCKRLKAEKDPSLTHAAWNPCQNTPISAARTDHLMVCWRPACRSLNLGWQVFAESSTDFRVATIHPPYIQQHRPSPGHLTITPNSHLIAVFLSVSISSKISVALCRLDSWLANHYLLGPHYR